MKIVIYSFKMSSKKKLIKKEIVSTNSISHEKTPIPEGLKLIIVESDTKATKIKKLLGSGFEVRATAGHFMEIDKKDNKELLNPKMVIKPLKIKKMNEIKQLASKANMVYIASDEDREGEAIAFHIAKYLKISTIEKNRMTFHEITKKALLQSLENIRTIDLHMVESQETRSIGDRLIGFSLSPHLWHIKPKLSAGRVQSVAVKFIVEKENEIRKNPCSTLFQMYVILVKNDILTKNCIYSARDIKKYEMKDLEKIQQNYEKNKQWTVQKIQTIPVHKKPPAPFTTSSLQQEAMRKYPSLSAEKVSKIAQTLYENGFTTYPRTDSTNMSQEFKELGKQWILSNFDDKYYHEWSFQNSADPNAQEAHECIRPTSLNYIMKKVVKTEAIKATSKLSLATDDDEFEKLEAMEPIVQKIYQLILYRSIACLMSSQELKRTEVSWIGKEISELQLKSSNTEEVFDGFMRIWRLPHVKKQSDEEESEPDDDPEGQVDEFNKNKKMSESGFPSLFQTWWKEFYSIKNVFHPHLKLNDIANSIKYFGLEEITGKIPRYTEATLVKNLEKKGIGRPSTYATIMNTILERGYVERKTVGGEKVSLQLFGKDVQLNKNVPLTTCSKMLAKEQHKLVPTHLGETVCHYLEKTFSNFMEYTFTAEMENELDLIAHGKYKKDILLKKWWLLIQELEEKLKKNIHTTISQNIENNQTEMNDSTKNIVSTNFASSSSFQKNASNLVKEFGMYENLPLKASNTKFGVRVQWGDQAQFMKYLIWDSITLDKIIPHLNKNYGKNDQGDDILLKNGQFGWYLEAGKQRISLSKEINTTTGKPTNTPTTKEEALLLFEKKDESKTPEGKTEEKKWVSGKKEFLSKKGPYGWYVKNGDNFINIPEDKKEDVWEYSPKKLKEWFDEKLIEKKEWMKKKKEGYLTTSETSETSSISSLTKEKKTSIKESSVKPKSKSAFGKRKVPIEEEEDD